MTMALEYYREQWWGGDTCRDRQHPEAYVDGRDNGPLGFQQHPASRLVIIFHAITANFLNQLPYFRFVVWPSWRDSCGHQPDIQFEIWKVVTVAAAKFYAEHCYSLEARTTLHLTGASASLLREGETEEKRGNSTSLLFSRKSMW